MTFEIYIMHHSFQYELAKITQEYYQSLGYRALIIEADFESTPEHKIRNWMAKNSDSDYAFQLDIDEYITQEDMLKAQAYVDRTRAVAYSCNIIDYTKIDRVVYPKRTHMPIFCVKKASDDIFWEHRCVNVNFLPTPIDIHHIGYIKCANLDFKQRNYVKRNHSELGVVNRIMEQATIVSPIPKSIEPYAERYIQAIV